MARNINIPTTIRVRLRIRVIVRMSSKASFTTCRRSAVTNCGSENTSSARASCARHSATPEAQTVSAEGDGPQIDRAGEVSSPIATKEKIDRLARAQHGVFQRLGRGDPQTRPRGNLD